MTNPMTSFEVFRSFHLTDLDLYPQIYCTDKHNMTRQQAKCIDYYFPALFQFLSAKYQ